MHDADELADYLQFGDDTQPERSLIFRVMHYVLSVFSTTIDPLIFNASATISISVFPALQKDSDCSFARF